MAVIVGVHGIAQELKGPAQLLTEWTPPLSDGLTLAGVELPDEGLSCAFYGDLFRPPGKRAAGAPNYRVKDVDEADAELLFRLWVEAARSDSTVVSPDAEVRRGTPKSVQTAVRTLMRSRFFSNMAESAFIGALKQVTSYMTDPAIKDAAQSRVDSAVTEDTRVLIGHSLGSVVAYEALHRFGREPRWASVRTFVTLGSPLGISNLIFDRLTPRPSGGTGACPAVDRWTNISDDADVVALVKDLNPLFGDPVLDACVHNGATVHKISPYLSAVETGRAVAAGLT
jgi:hypothetical protein